MTTELIYLNPHRKHMAFHAVFASIFNVSNFVILTKMLQESSDGVVVRALASHQCGPGSIPRLGVICGLTLLVLFIALRGFAPGTPVFPSPQKLAFDYV